MTTVKFIFVLYYIGSNILTRIEHVPKRRFWKNKITMLCFRTTAKIKIKKVFSTALISCFELIALIFFLEL